MLFRSAPSEEPEPELFLEEPEPCQTGPKLDANVASGLLYCAGDTIRSNNNWCAVLYYLHDVCPY